MDPWILKLGPWGLIRPGVLEVRGWRRWWRRIWRRLPGDPMNLGDWQDPDVRLEPPPALDPPAMHWSPAPVPMGRPICGADPNKVSWTVEVQAATCPPCLAAAIPMILQHRVNTR
jgi:hypothetical protein